MVLLRCYFFILFCAVTTFLKTETKKELQHKLHHSTNNTTYCKLSNKLFWKYIFENTDSALIYAKIGISHANGEDASICSMVNNNVGVYYYFIDQFDSANLYYHKATQFAIQANDSSQWAKCLNNLGIVSDIRGDYPKAAAYYNDALTLHRKMKNDKSIAECLNNLAVVYKLNGKLDDALEMHLQAIEIQKTIDDKAGIASNANNLGLIYTEKGELASAIKWYTKALEIDEQYNYNEETANVYLNMANLYSGQGLTDIALHYYAQAIYKYRAIQQESGIAVCKMSIAQLLFSTKDYLQAENNLKECLELFDKIGFAEKQLEAYLNYIDLALAQNKFELADTLTLQAKKLVQAINTPENNADFIYALASIEHKKGNYSLAIGHLNQTIEKYLATQKNNKTAKSLLLKANCELLSNQAKKALQTANKASKLAKNGGDLNLMKEISYFEYLQYAQLKQYKNAIEKLALFHELNDSLTNKNNIRKISSFFLKQDYELRLETLANKAKTDQKILLLKIGYQKNARNIALLFSGALLLTLFLIYLEYKKKKHAYNLLIEKADKLAAHKIEKEKKEKEKSSVTINEDLQKQLIKKLDKHLLKNKKYLQPGITLSDVSKALKTNNSYLSKLIHLKYAKNFNQLINELRIQDACVMIHKGEHKNLTIEGIALNVGFKNRATFNEAFKKHIGVPPSYYIESLKENT